MEEPKTALECGVCGRQFRSKVGKMSHWWTQHVKKSFEEELAKLLSQSEKNLESMSPNEFVATIESCFKSDMALSFLQAVKDDGAYFCYACSDLQNITHKKTCSHFQGSLIKNEAGNVGDSVRHKVSKALRQKVPGAGFPQEANQDKNPAANLEVALSALGIADSPEMVVHKDSIHGRPFKENAYGHPSRTDVNVLDDTPEAVEHIEHTAISKCEPELPQVDHEQTLNQGAKLINPKSSPDHCFHKRRASTCWTCHPGLKPSCTGQTPSPAIEMLPTLIQSRLLMFIDTETTGVSSKDRIVQIAWQLYAEDTINLVSSDCFIVKPTDYKITSKSIEIHGITQERAFKEGQERRRILEELKLALLRSETVIAHNMSFEDRMISSELNRLGDDDLLNLWTEKTKVCTMKEARSVYGGRNLKLSDLYLKVIGGPLPDNIHSADVDTNMCALVYFKMKKHK